MRHISQTGQLLLAPFPTGGKTEIQPLLNHLRQVGLLGPPLEGLGNNAFQIGEAFLQLVTFMGCSPHIEVAPPPQGGPFCYLRIDGPWPKPLLRHGHNTQAPRCVHCRARIIDWQRMLPEWLAEPEHSSIICPRCSNRQSPLDLGWRRQAGFGWLFIVIEDIFPGEAIPVPALLSGLAQVTNNPWQYFYVRA